MHTQTWVEGKRRAKLCSHTTRVTSHRKQTLKHQNSYGPTMAHKGFQWVNQQTLEAENRPIVRQKTTSPHFHTHHFKSFPLSFFTCLSLSSCLTLSLISLSLSECFYLCFFAYLSLCMYPSFFQHVSLSSSLPIPLSFCMGLSFLTCLSLPLSLSLSFCLCMCIPLSLPTPPSVSLL